MAQALDRQLTMLAGPSILFVTKRLGVGGAERHLAQLLPQLRARGINAALFVLERGGELEPVLATEGVAVEGVKPNGSRLRDLFRAGVALGRCIRHRQPDLIHFFLPEAYLVGGVVATLVGHRRCIMSRRSLAHYQRGRPLLAWLERLMHHRMLAVLGNSQAVVDELTLETRDPDKVGLIHNGVAIPAAASDSIRVHARNLLGFEVAAFLIVVVANLISYKGHADIISALAGIAPQLPKPWQLLLVGRDEGIGRDLMKQAESCGIADQVTFLGERDDVEAILRTADISLLASHQEGFSNALLEAMAQGLPVIATSVGGNRDAIEDGLSGRLVPVQDPARLGEAILAFSRDAGLRARIGGAARERVFARFSQKACIDFYHRLYTGIAELGLRPVQDIIDGGTSKG